MRKLQTRQPRHYHHHKQKREKREREKRKIGGRINVFFSFVVLCYILNKQQRHIAAYCHLNCIYVVNESDLEMDKNSRKYNTKTTTSLM